MRMLMRKRVLSLGLALWLCVVLCGCSAGAQTGSGADTVAPKTLAEVVSLDFDGEPWTVENLEQGKLLARNIGYAEDGAMLWYIDYEYGENGQISKAWVYDAENNLMNPEPQEEEQ